MSLSVRHVTKIVSIDGVTMEGELTTKEVGDYNWNESHWGVKSSSGTFYDLEDWLDKIGEGKQVVISISVRQPNDDLLVKQIEEDGTRNVPKPPPSETFPDVAEERMRGI